MTKRCLGCGICCETMIIPDYGYNPETIKLRDNYIKTVEYDDKTYYIMRSKCKYLIGTKCKRYDRRPQECKTFPKGCEGLWAVINPACGMIQDD